MATIASPRREPLIPLSVPELRGNEWRYVKECLDSNWVSSVGAFVDRFEAMVAERLGRRFAVATVNGTAALHVALRVAGIEPDDEVLVPTLTFIAPVNAIRYLGAWPVLIDADPATWQMDPERTTDFLARECQWAGGELRNRETGRRVRALLPVSILGHPCDFEPLLTAARRYDLRVVEDAAEGLGAGYRGRPVGTAGDLACLSFNGNKIVTTGGGGMIVTDDETSARRARYLTTQAKDDPVEYIHGEIGYNYRLTNLQAAVGCAQLEQLDAYVARKRALAAAYRSALAEVPGLTPMPEAPWAASTFWLYTVLVDPEGYGIDSRGLLAALAERGIQTRPLWQPAHRSPAHRDLRPASCPVADRLYAQALSLPCSVGLTDADQQRVIAAIRAGRPAAAGGVGGGE
jgi:perosamine synthetase